MVSITWTDVRLNSLPEMKSTHDKSMHAVPARDNISYAEQTVQHDEIPHPPPPPKFEAGTELPPDPEEQLKADITFFTFELPHLGQAVLCSAG